MVWKLTEKSWLSCVPWEMLYRHLLEEGPAVSDRKMRLFAASCLRRICPLLSEKARAAIEVVERLADGGIGGRELREFQGPEFLTNAPGDRSVHWALVTGSHVHKAIETSLRIAWRMTSPTIPWREEDRHWSGTFRDVVGNPFRPAPFEPAWRTRTVQSVARAAYEDRVLPAGALHADTLAILADALEDAGCTNQDILTHLRGPGQHTRGCWAVDCCLGRC